MSETKWIPVTEKLPDDDIAKFVTIDIDVPDYISLVTDVAYYDGGEWYLCGGRGKLCLEVTAWMPLPKPYRRELELI